jgi:hypothetical protein
MNGAEDMTEENPNNNDERPSGSGEALKEQ